MTAVAAVLRLWAFGAVGPNPFYDAAVRSMSLSWHNFLFGALEPGARLAIDKAPADLWLQVASVKLFGFSGVAMRVPECAAAVAAVPLLYDLVRRIGGPIAGLGAAATLAVLPTAILTAHSDTMDSLMMLLSVLAAWLVVVGNGRVGPATVIAAGAVVGLAFNVKLFEALIFVPALAVLVAATGQGTITRRAATGAGAAAAAVVVGLGWIAAASLTPLGRRPWPFGSTNGSIWNVVFQYDGFGRLSTPASAAALRLDPPGPWRLLSTGGHDYAATIGTTLLAAVVIGLLAVGIAAVSATVHQRLDPPAAEAAPTAATRRDGQARLRLAGTVFFALWLVIGVALLSHMQRLQPRYLEAMTPAIAGAVGLALARLAREPSTAAGMALAVGAAGVAIGDALLTGPPMIATGVALTAVVACAALVWRNRRHEHPPAARPAVAAALVALLAVPASAAIATAGQHRSDAGLPSRMSPGVVDRLAAFVRAGDPSGRTELVSPTAMRAAPVIVKTGRPLLILTSVGGRPLASPQQLAGLVADGRVRYALLGPDPCSTAPAGHCAPAIRWAQHHSQDVSVAAGLPPQTLYAITSAGTTTRPIRRARRRPSTGRAFVRDARHRAGAARSMHHRGHHRRQAARA